MDILYSILFIVKELNMENNISEKDKEKNKIIWMLTITVIILLLVCVYFVFIKGDKEEPVKPQDNSQVEKDITLLNDGLRNLLFKELTLNEFKEQAKQYCTDDLITKLSEYYIFQNIVLMHIFEHLHY